VAYAADTGGTGVAASVFLLLWRHRKKMPAPMRARPPIPPTTPPTMAPTGVEEPPSGGGGFDVVGPGLLVDVVDTEMVGRGRVVCVLEKELVSSARGLASTVIRVVVLPHPKRV
jgi:hypothetical protein